MMQSAVYAITWQFWRRSFWPFLINTSALYVLIAICCAPFLFAGLSFKEAETSMGTKLHLPLLGMAIVLASATINLSHKSLVPSFSLPISTSSLVVWSLINSILLAVLTYLPAVLVLSYLVRPALPIWEASCFAALAVMWAQAIHWSWRSSMGLQVVAYMCLLFTSFSFLSWRCQPDNRAEIHLHLALTVAELICIFALAVIGFALCIAGVARDRRGDGPNLSALLSWLSRWDERLLCRLLRPNRRFSSPSDALDWYEWQHVGSVPLGVAIVTVSFVVWSMSPWSTPHSIVDSGVGLTCLAIYLCLFLGMTFGDLNQPTSSFRATRPVTNTEIAHSALRSVSITGAIAWMIWLSGLVLISGTIVLNGQLPGVQNSIETYPWSGELGVWWIPTFLACAVVVSWILAANSSAISLCQSRPVLFLTGMTPILGISVPIACFIFSPQIVSAVLTIAFSALTFAGTMAAFTSAFRSKMIGPMTLALSVIGYILLATVFLFVAPKGTSSLIKLLLLATSCLPFLPFAAAPLAAGWSRHR